MAELKPFEVIFKLSPRAVKHEAQTTEVCFMAEKVQELVRCENCKHGTRLVCDLAGNEGIECRHGNIVHRLDWFCSDGAKMDKEEE